jgi:DNA adenine methylase
VPRPFVKWAGGKGQLLPTFQGLYPAPGTFQRYIDPFVGGGAVFFHVSALFRPKATVLSDTNAELIGTYQIVRDQVDALLEELAEHKARHSERHYYQVREQPPERLDPVARAARFIYLNKTGFNGLYRVNSRGLFNVPFGRYRNPGIVDADVLREASTHLQKVTLQTEDFRDVLKIARRADFVYFDPPYDPVSRTAYFTSYTQASFGPKDQERLAEVYAHLASRGSKVMLSNSDTPFIRRLYRDFEIRTVLARRNINSNASRRGPVPELVVINYQPGEGPRTDDDGGKTSYLAGARVRRSAWAKAGKLANRVTATARPLPFAGSTGSGPSSG